jgi:TrmH family RNA methyltransferase
LHQRCRTLGVPALHVSAEILASLSDTVTPQGIVAVVPFPAPARPAAPGVAVVTDGLRDPGNLGTLLRSAAAAGAERVLLGPGTADPYNAKVLRGAMGAHFRLPPESLSWPEVAEALRDRPVWLADARGEARYDQVDWARPCGLIIGGEAEGASAEAAALATGRVAIPLAREVESLNAAVAASILLFEAARQRRAAGAGELTVNIM